MSRKRNTQTIRNVLYTNVYGVHTMYCQSRRFIGLAHVFQALRVFERLVFAVGWPNTSPLAPVPRCREQGGANAPGDTRGSAEQGR